MSKEEAFAFESSASLMCADLMNLERDIHALEGARCDELHFDIMDGQFVPNLTLGSDMIKAAKGVTAMHCNAHLMIENPERYIEQFVSAGADSISVHVEASPHIHRVLSQIREAGASPGIAINPATPLTKLDYLLASVDRVLVMTVDPGYAGQKIINSAFERVRALRNYIDHRGLSVKIEVDGNINVNNAAHLYVMGARTFVLGTSSVFVGGDPGDNLTEFLEQVARQRHLV